MSFVFENVVFHVCPTVHLNNCSSNVWRSYEAVIQANLGLGFIDNICGESSIRRFDDFDLDGPSLARFKFLHGAAGKGSYKSSQLARATNLKSKARTKAAGQEADHNDVFGCC